jgi:hypothetical protein
VDGYDFFEKLMIIAILGRTPARVLVDGGDLSLRKDGIAGRGHIVRETSSRMTKGKNLEGKVFPRRVELRLMSDLVLFKRSLKLVKNGTWRKK